MDELRASLFPRVGHARHPGPGAGGAQDCPRPSSLWMAWTIMVERLVSLVSWARRKALSTLQYYTQKRCKLHGRAQASHQDQLDNVIIRGRGVPHIIGYVIDLLFSAANDVSVGSLQREEARIEAQNSPHTARQLLYFGQGLKNRVYQ